MSVVQRVTDKLADIYGAPRAAQAAAEELQDAGLLAAEPRSGSAENGSKYSKLLVETANMSKRQTTALWDYVDELRATMGRVHSELSSEDVNPDDCRETCIKLLNETLHGSA